MSCSGLLCKRRRVIKVKRNTIFSLFPTRFLLVCWYFLDVFLCVYIYSWDRVNSHEYGYFGFINFTRLRGSLCDFNSVEHDIADDLFLISTTILIVPVTFGGPLWFPVNCLWSFLVYYYQPFLLMLGNQDHFLTFMWWFPFFSWHCTISDISSQKDWKTMETLYQQEVDRVR